MNTNGITMSARRGIIWIGKYAPFVIVAIVTLSNIEALYSLLAEQYAEYNGEIVYYKPISWFIGNYFKLSIAWVAALAVLSVGVDVLFHLFRKMFIEKGMEATKEGQQLSLF